MDRRSGFLRPEHAGGLAGRFQTPPGEDGSGEDESLLWGGTKAKRSPKDRSAVPEGVNTSKVAIDLTGRDAPRQGPRRRPGSGQQDRSGLGTNLAKWAGLVVLCPDNSPHHPAEPQ